jgi:hypothetical protein
MDNGTALLVFSGIFNGGLLAARMLKHGQEVDCIGNSPFQAHERAVKFRPLAWLLGGFRTRYFWNCENPDMFCFTGWHGRSPGYMALMNKIAKKSNNPINDFILAVSLFWPFLFSTARVDGIKGAYLTLSYLHKTTKGWSILAKLWEKTLLKFYPRGMRGVYDEYYRDPEHPLRKYSNYVTIFNAKE